MIKRSNRALDIFKPSSRPRSRIPRPNLVIRREGLSSGFGERRLAGAHFQCDIADIERLVITQSTKAFKAFAHGERNVWSEWTLTRRAFARFAVSSVFHFGLLTWHGDPCAFRRAKLFFLVSLRLRSSRCGGRSSTTRAAEVGGREHEHLGERRWKARRGSAEKGTIGGGFGRQEVGNWVGTNLKESSDRSVIGEELLLMDKVFVPSASPLFSKLRHTIHDQFLGGCLFPAGKFLGLLCLLGDPLSGLGCDAGKYVASSRSRRRLGQRGS
ncbi:unnamed protein product [Rhizoctonia solani]|nr:unnamed protein product [Rhizoctonia solani]